MHQCPGYVRTDGVKEGGGVHGLIATCGARGELWEEHVMGRSAAREEPRPEKETEKRKM